MFSKISKLTRLWAQNVCQSHSLVSTPLPVSFALSPLFYCSLSEIATADQCQVCLAKVMDPAELRYLEEEDTPLMKTIKGATSGLVAGTIWGTIVATWQDVPRVERRVALPGLIRTLKMMGNHGITFAAIGGVYIGVEQLLQNYRMKRDFINGAVGGFAAGATVVGYKGKSIATALSAGAALAATSAFIDVGGQTTRIDNGKEYYPYTTKKRASAD
ncbi:unnamed protein product [Coffea canephora]|uniref:DH200=94 genomic scaffold, scaffold_835 n=2 Tax=Coffea TaxID=13442 RepID=A0A068VH32_COFCA|nr:unnamed protein product [Coffea canephora]